MKLFLAVLTMIIAASMFSDPAYASRNRYSSGHSSGGTKREKTVSFAQKKCKTDACYKKHPTGRYSIPMHKKQNN